jgi:hypothetical protein
VSLTCLARRYDQKRVRATKAGARGNELKNAGKEEEAKAVLGEALAEYPTAPMAAAWMGELLSKVGGGDSNTLHYNTLHYNTLHYNAL